ncbi:putative aminoacyl-tRNA synthetase, class Ic, tetratricopeptide-like helical domain superfamily [Helianthus annuus]|nr:putative aminoacyl-tRNA synthetase, class Ic, tetratricopeptide-like helical domain superfamily [Helianthus annuus]
MFKSPNVFPQHHKPLVSYPKTELSETVSSTNSFVGHEIPKLLKYLLHFLGKKSSWYWIRSSLTSSISQTLVHASRCLWLASKLKKLQIVMTSLILPTASLSTPPQSPISSSSSRIQHTLTQRIHIPPHIYKHPAAILLELCTSLQELHQIIPLIIKNGLYQEHLFQTKLVSLFCKYNSLTEATRVFEPIEDKNDALYHTMLKGYAQNSSISDGFSFFCRMVEDGVQPVVYNFTYLLKGCGENNYVREGKEVHAQVILNGHEGDIYVMTCVVNMYAKCKLVEDAYKVFVRLPERDLVCWNTIIAGYAQNGFAGRAIELVAQMLSEGLRPDPVTVISILPAVGNVGDLRVGKSIHGYVFKSGYERHGNVATALVDMYLKCGCLSTGRVIFDKMSSKNVVSWNIMIDGYAQNDDYAEALSLFDKMLDNGFKPTGVTVMAALHACADLGELTRGLFVHSLVNELGLKHDVSVMNSLISMYCKCKRVDIAAEIFKNMKEKTLVSWNAMILGYAQNGQIISALNHFRLMKVKNIDPDSFTMVSIIAAVTEFSVLRQAKWVHGVVTRTCLDTNVFVKTALVDMYAKCGAITTARKLFDLMNDRHVTTWNAMIDGYGTHGYGTEAIKLFKKMEAGDIKPNNITFLCIISACSHSGFVEEGCQYFYKMKNEYEIEPTMDHYGAMVDLLGRSGACKIHKNVELVEMAADRLFELNPNDGGYYVLLANIYATASMWDKVTEIRSKMEERGIRKTPGYSSVELENEVHTFYSGSSWHSDSNKIYNFLEILIDKIKDAGYVPATDLMQDVEDDLQEQMSDLVPVGEDQKQHLELTRELAERVNHLYGGRKWKKLGGRGGLIFKVPEPLIPPAGARVMSLTDGLSKMSKSATSDLSRINLLDSKDAIANKIKRCKTDSFPGLEFDNPDRPECNNLLSIYQIITNKTKEEVAQECQSMNSGTFKPVLTDALIDHLQPIQARYEEIMSDTGYLDQVLAEGASKAADIADVTVSNVYQAMGFLKRR